MEQKLNLNAVEMVLIESALDQFIYILKNRFEEEVEYVHPAQQYQKLCDKLTEWLNTLPAGNYSISHEKIA